VNLLGALTTITIIICLIISIELSPVLVNPFCATQYITRRRYTQAVEQFPVTNDRYSSIAALLYPFEND
jgi:hypothetical protein